MSKKTAIQKVKDQTYAIDKPSQMTQMAKILKDHIVKNNLYAAIKEKNYVMVEGWQFAGGLMGLFPRIVKVESIGKDKWLAQAEIVNQKTQAVISTGFAICSKEESKKASFDEYAILSMAQTRAIGKAFRNLLGWVMKLAGYEATPAEEMKKGPEGTPVQIKPEPISKADGLYASEGEKQRIMKIADELGYKEGSLDMFIGKKTGLAVHMQDMTKTQASRILAELLRIQLDQKDGKRK